MNAGNVSSQPQDRVPASRLALALGLAAAVTILWLVNTPEGLLGKAEAVGYAVCHRIDLRSFHLGERSLPLCSRCTGMYLGAMLAFLAFPIAGRGRVGGFPDRKVVPFLAFFFLAFAVDGINSYLHFFPVVPHLYEPRNELRLITGTALGLGMGAIVFAGFNQNSWIAWDKRPILRGPGELLLLTIGGALTVGLVMSDNPLILYPLALVSSLGVVLMLAAVYSVLVMLLLRLENRARAWADLLIPLGLGLALAIAHIGAFNLVRYALFGTWSGFSL